MSYEVKISPVKAFSASLLAAVMVGSIVTSVVTFTEFVGTKKEAKNWASFLSSPVSFDFSAKEKLDSLNAEIKSVNSIVAAMRESADKSYPNMDLSVMDGKLDDLSRRLKLLESAIASDPEKALVVPMLRKDHELLVKQFNDCLVASKLDYDRLWGMLMILLTTFGAAVVGVSGWALKSLLTKASTGSAVTI
ncbi:hypothetical protein ACTORR_24365 [Pseudomonas sp. SAR267]|uniref:hypothetical protein n=1 Tax=Pseudomonas sp. SAR267 TaxID=3454502 RepID=UPI003F937216